MLANVVKTLGITVSVVIYSPALGPVVVDSEYPDIVFRTVLAFFQTKYIDDSVATFEA